MERSSLGNKIYQLRKNNNMSQQNLADKLCVSNKTISKWECGNGSPDVETLNKIANIFEISVDELLNENSKNSEEIITDNNNSISQKNVKSKKMLTTIALCISLSIVVLVSLLCYFLIPKSPEIINTKLFSIDKNNSTLYCIVNNEQLSLDLSQEIEVSKKSTWGIYTDRDGLNEISSKTLNLEIGDNKFYIIIKNSANKKKVYETTIRRKPIFTITFNSLGGSDIPNQSISEGSYCSPKTPTKNGYNFLGWYQTESDLETFPFNETPIKSDMNFIAKWDPITYTIRYENPFSEVENPINKTSFNITSETFNIEPLNKNGYSFDGWFDDNNFETANKIEKINQGTAKNYILYAKWSVIEYEITYVTSDLITNGKLSEDVKLTYTIEDSFELETPFSLGYQFVNWYDHKDFETQGNVVEGITKGTTGNKTFYAKWTDEFDHEGYRRLDSTDDFLTYKNNALYFSDNARLYSNITLETSTKNDAWTTIGTNTNKFTAIFDGNGYTISHFNPKDLYFGLGLFGYTDGATIKNLKIEYSKFELKNLAINFGGLVYSLLNSTVDNCSVIIDIDLTMDIFVMWSSLSVGGICNSMNNSTISNSYFSGNINIVDRLTFGHSIGGIVSSMTSGKIENCFTNSSINVNNVNGTKPPINIGGLVGKMTNGEIINSFTTGNYKATSMSARIGGLVGEMVEGTITNSFATGDVYTAQSSETSYAGHLVGLNTNGAGVLTNCYGCVGQVVEGYTINSSEQKTFDELIAFTKENYDLTIWEFDETETELPYLKKLSSITSVMIGYNPDDLTEHKYYQISSTHNNLRIKSIIENFDTSLLEKEGYTFVGWYIYKLDLPWNPDRNTVSGGIVGINIIAKYEKI